jgi:hypothetical protein
VWLLKTVTWRGGTVAAKSKVAMLPSQTIKSSNHQEKRLISQHEAQAEQST